MARKERQKKAEKKEILKQVQDEKEVSSAQESHSDGSDITLANGVIVSHETSDEITKETLHDEIKYIELKSHEAIYIGGLIEAFYREVNLVEAADNLILYINTCIRPLLSMENAECIVAYKGEASYDMKQKDILGYIIGRVDYEVTKKPFLYVEQLYIKPENRGGKLVEELIARIGILGRRFNTKKIEIEARTSQLQRLWSKMGFGIESSKMVFMGTPDQFCIKNPAYAERGRYNGIEEQK